MKPTHTNIEWSLFRKALMEQLNPEEQLAFSDWLEANPQNKIYFNKAQAYFKAFDTTEEIFDTDYQTAWGGFRQYTLKQNRIIKLRWLRVAAIFTGLAFASYLLFTQLKQKPTPELTHKESVLKPGKSVAKLTLENGNVIYLENQDTLISLKGAHAAIAIDSGMLAYSQVTGKRGDLPRKNKIEIPRGGEYMVKLADGTKVWLNSESTLEYTVPFDPAKREVSLTGEAYFEVTKDAKHPFIVKTAKMNIRVLGTHFNVTAYKDEETVKTTLVEGRVQVSSLLPLVSSSPRLLVLSPGEQSTLDEKGELKVKTVDTDACIAWTQGYFVFENESLSSIFRKLSRWYDIKAPVAGNKAEKELFSGKLPRFQNFEVVLDLIRKVSKVDMKMDGKNVVIK